MMVGYFGYATISFTLGDCAYMMMWYCSGYSNPAGKNLKSLRSCALLSGGCQLVCCCPRKVVLVASGAEPLEMLSTGCLDNVKWQWFHAQAFLKEMYSSLVSTCAASRWFYPVSENWMSCVHTPADVY